MSIFSLNSLLASQWKQGAWANIGGIYFSNCITSYIDLKADFFLQVHINYIASLLVSYAECLSACLHTD